MTTIFDAATREALISRIQALDPLATPLWGKMKVFHMTVHCLIWNRWILGVDNPISYRHDLLGKIFGRRALRYFTRDDRPIGKNIPTGKAFLVKEIHGELAIKKQQLVETISGFTHFNNPADLHDFFGKMTKKQIGIFAYKHMDHHLRQFGV
ncbi:DUF1569 domain-containing protein [Lewinella sp. IMCC34191]|uniref:DUF1569 domain-containing protein n=1 Tax=Lewinella sp. IMCC34191 TaxID=2259172 RepID=UPI000E23D728|nr:DUF1569 domain-containing protein [Lewinella sp. IMCC34191]